MRPPVASAPPAESRAASPARGGGPGSKLRVSDHALVRFLVRAGGFEVEAVRAALAASLARAARAAGTIGSAEYAVVADGLTYIVRDGVVVTVLRDRPREPAMAGKPPAAGRK